MWEHLCIPPVLLMIEIRFPPILKDIYLCAQTHDIFCVLVVSLSTRPWSAVLNDFFRYYCSIWCGKNFTTTRKSSLPLSSSRFVKKWVNLLHCKQNKWTQFVITIHPTQIQKKHFTYLEIFAKFLGINKI